MFLSAVWTHSDGTHSLQSVYFYQLFGLILTAPIHCRTSIFISCLDSFWWHPFTAEHLFLSAVWTHSDGTHSLQNIHFYQLFGLILTAPIHCRTSIFISCLDSFWRHPFTAEHLFLSAVWTHSDGTHSLQNIHFYQLFGLILTAPIHCRASNFISCLDLFWRHPFTAEHLFLSAVWTHSNGTHSLQSIYFYQLFGLILTAPIHCRASNFISCLDSFWRHPFTAEHPFLSAVWTHSDGTHSLQNIYFYQLFGLILTAPIHCRTSIFISCLDSFWRHPFTAEHQFLSWFGHLKVSLWFCCLAEYGLFDDWIKQYANYYASTAN